MFSIAEQPTILSSSSSSDIVSVVSTSTREARLATALAKRVTAQSKYELAMANQEVAEAQEEALVHSPSGSIAQLGDVQSEGGSSARARQRSFAEMAVPPLPMERVAEVPVLKGKTAQDKRWKAKAYLREREARLKGLPTCFIRMYLLRICSRPK